MLGLQVEYVLPAEAGGTSFATMAVRQQRATYDLVSHWTGGAEGCKHRRFPKAAYGVIWGQPVSGRG